MGQGTFGPHRLQSPLLTLFSSYTFACLRRMSPLCPQSNTFLLSGELNSDPFWVDGATCSTLREETGYLFEGSPTTFDGSAVQSTHHLFPLFDDGHLGPPLTSGGAERVDDADFTLFAPSASLDVQHDDLYARLSRCLHPR